MFDFMHMNMTFFHGFGMLIFWIIIIFLIISVIQTKDKKNTDTALEILKKRLAKGEISQEQFNSMKESIS